MITDTCDIQNLDINNTTPLKFTCGSCYLPKHNKAKPQGEDAHFICRERNTIGVADGVGSWARKGIDAGEYARQLMANSITALSNQTKGSTEPGRILLSAYRKTRAKGTSTALIIALNENNDLLYSNLGDSGMAVFRNKKLFYKSPIQQHGFDRPYQLGRGISWDIPKMANEGAIPVKDGDVVVVGTDGLWDNVYPCEIEEILRQRKGDFDVGEMAAKIAKRASCNSVDRTYFSPFAKAAAMKGRSIRGGKYNDITVVVAKVEPELRVTPKINGLTDLDAPCTTENRYLILGSLGADY